MDSKTLNVDKKGLISLYKKNVLPYKISLLSILAEVVYVVTVLDKVETNYMMGIIVGINILLLFMLFTCAVKVNVYNQVWNLISAGVAVYMILRALIFVPFILKPMGKLPLLMAANFVGAGLLLISFMISLKNINRRLHAAKYQQI